MDEFKAMMMQRLERVTLILDAAHKNLIVVRRDISEILEDLEKSEEEELVIFDEKNDEFILPRKDK